MGGQVTLEGLIIVILRSSSCLFVAVLATTVGVRSNIREADRGVVQSSTPETSDNMGSDIFPYP